MTASTLSSFISFRSNRPFHFIEVLVPHWKEGSKCSHWRSIAVCLVARVNSDVLSRLKQLFSSSSRCNNVLMSLIVKSCTRDESGRSRVTWKVFPDRWLECGLDVDVQLCARVCELCNPVAVDLRETDFPRYYHKILDSWTT